MKEVIIRIAGALLELVVAAVSMAAALLSPARTAQAA
jgi:hypothetical protein